MAARSVVSVALVTAGEFVAFDADLPLIESAASGHDLSLQVVDWHDDTFDWTGVDIAVVRSPWDYTWHLDDFLGWAERVEGATRLLNPLTVVRWNTDKRYLIDLAGQGVPVVPTQVVEPGQSFVFPGDAEVVVKPVVSAGARNTDRYPSSRFDEARIHVGRLHAAGRAALVQPYLPAIEGHGETGLVFIGDRFSHGFRKDAILRHDQQGDERRFRPDDIAPRVPSSSELSVAEAALDAVQRCTGDASRSDLLYARVDLVPGPGGPLLLELELVEPSLFCVIDGESPSRVVAALEACRAG